MSDPKTPPHALRRPVRVSRHGLTECGGCRRHLKIAADGRETVCPFCGTSLRGPVAQPGALLEMMRRWGGGTASGLMAASLLAGCGGEEALDSADAGVTAQEGYNLTEPEADNLTVQSKPYVDDGRKEGRRSFDPRDPVLKAEDPLVQAIYGVPPTPDEPPITRPVPDASITLTESDAETVFQPLYGVVPAPDAGTGDAAN